MKPDYSFQPILVNEVIHRLKTESNMVVLAAAPGAGKTKMALDIYEKLGLRTLVLTHGQRVIRHQWAKRIKDRKIPFTEITSLSGGSELKDYKENLLISIPQTIFGKTNNAKIDLLITDEGHERYFAQQVSDIRKSLKPKYEVILTGTPHTFVKNPAYSLVYRSANQLIKDNVIQDPDIELIETPYDIRPHEYNIEHNLSSGKHFSQKDTHLTVEAAIRYIKKERGEIGKTMIICHNRRQAADINNYLIKNKFIATLSISMKEDKINSGNLEIDAFQECPEINFLIVVKRGIIGFDYANLENIIDMGCTINPYVLFQSICRLVRPNPKPKLFLKIVSKESMIHTYLMMSFAISLSHEKYYTQIFSKTQTSFPVYKKDHKGNLSIKECRLFKMGEIDPLNTAAHTTFSDVIKNINKGTFDYMAILDMAKTFSSRAEFRRERPREYKMLYKSGLFSLLDNIFPPREAIDWFKKTDEELLIHARDIIEKEGYKNFYKFRMDHSALYKHFLKRNLRDKVGLGIQRHKYWTYEKAIKIANRYKNKPYSLFIKNHSDACAYLRDIGRFPNYWTPKKAKIWTDKELIAIAKNYKTIRSFRVDHHGGYRYLLANKHLFNEIPNFKSKKRNETRK